MDLAAAVADTVERRRLIPAGARVLVAVSGGPDSCALLHCLLHLGWKVEAAHLNHGFRGAESDGDAAFVDEFCRSLGIPLASVSMDIPGLAREQRASAQVAARNARYSFLEQVREKRGLDLIATAHNRDDRIETILLNIVRGAGVDGLAGIPYQRGRIVRPLLDTPRTEVERYVAAHSLTPRIDSSNSSNKYARNSVRSELLPLLERRFNPAVRNSILRLSDIAADESAFIGALAATWLGKRSVLLVEDVRAEPVGFQRRILREWLRSQVDGELSDVSLILIEQFRMRMEQPCAVTLPGGTFIAESTGTSMLVRKLDQEAPRVVQPTPLEVGEEVLFDNYLVSLLSVGSGVDLPSLQVRQWADGDRITLKGGTRKVQDVFTDAKVPRTLRRTYPLIADKQGIVAVGDIRCAARAGGTVVSVITLD